MKRRTQAEIDADIASANSICRKCGNEKPKEDFPRTDKFRSGYGTSCKICLNTEKTRARHVLWETKSLEWHRRRQDATNRSHSLYHNRHPEKRAEKTLRRACRAVGITVEYYNSLPKVCAICGSTESQKRKDGKRFMLNKDHDHKTGKFRGLLCHRHNTAFGHVHDRIEELEKMIAYLKNHSER